MIAAENETTSVDDQGLRPMYRMPVAFGPAPGPRNVPPAQASVARGANTLACQLSATTDRDLLLPLLPRCVSVRERARLTVTVLRLRGVGWLAGRGYNVVSVTVPVTFRGSDETVEGDFILAMWESLADQAASGIQEPERDARHRIFPVPRPRWEDMPTQYPVVAALASLPLHEFDAGIVRVAESVGVGEQQRILGAHDPEPATAGRHNLVHRSPSLEESQ